MWVLAPLPGLNAASQAGEAQPQDQTIYLTASGEISIGRPLKKGSTVGKADILIFNKQSVSSIHANLFVGAGSTQQDGSFTHGSLSITDVSRFGTFLTRGGDAEQKLSNKTPVELQNGDTLKFGSHTRYRVKQLPVVLVASSTCHAQHPQLQSTAAALNCQLTTSWPPPAAGEDEQEGGAVQAYCVVAPSGELLTPAVLRALLTTSAAAEGCARLVTPAWLEAVSARRAWPGELPAPNQQPEHSPASFMLPGQQQQHGADAGLDEQQQQQQLLQLSSWSQPGPQLLSGFMLVFGKGCQEDLAAAAAACGAHTLLLASHRGRLPSMAALHKQAAQAGQRAILVTPSHAFQQQQQQQQRKQRTPQKQQAGKAADHMAGLSEVQLLLAVARGSAEPLQQAADAFAAQHDQQQQTAAAAPTATAAAAAGGSEGGDETEADATEGEEEEEGQPPAAGQDTPAAAAGTDAAAGAAGAAAGAAAVLGGPVGLLLPVSPAGVTQQQARPAVSTADLTGADGWHSHAPSSSAATQSRSQGRTAGSKRAATELTAAAAAAEPDSAAAAAATPSKRRRTAAAGASPTKSALAGKRKGRPQQQQQQQQQQRQQDPAAALCPGTGSAFDALQGSADGAGVQGSGTGAEQQQGRQGLGCSTEVVVPLLCVTTSQQQQQQQRNGAVGGGPQVPDYKAFRRRGEAQQQQQQVVVVDLVAADAAHLQGPDIDTFLRDEKHRQDRLRKADELFHTHLKPIKAPAAAAAAGRAVGKTAAAARGRKK